MGNIHLVTGCLGQPHITAADQAMFNASIFGSDQFVLDRGNKFAASVITNNQVRVLDGDILMQGRYIRLNEDTYVDLVIENGTQGYYRKDLIVARYTKDASTGVEDCNLVVIKGENATSDPANPAYTNGDIINGRALLNDMPLYVVSLDGINVQGLSPLFTVKATGFSPIAHNHPISDVNGLQADLDSKSNTGHTHAANDITAGTFAGQVVANGSGQNAGTSLLRNSKLASAETDPTVNGEICWTYA